MKIKTREEFLDELSLRYFKKYKNEYNSKYLYLTFPELREAMKKVIQEWNELIRDNKCGCGWILSRVFNKETNEYERHTFECMNQECEMNKKGIYFSIG